MKKTIVIFFLFTTSFILGQTKANDVLGYYMNPTGEGILKIYETAGKYAAKLVWMKHPQNLDTKNPDKTKRNQKILGSVVMYDFIFDGESWKNGRAYDPKNGKTYDCKISRDEKGNLFIRGYLGISLLGRTDYFVKVNFKE